MSVTVKNPTAIFDFGRSIEQAISEGFGMGIPAAMAAGAMLLAFETVEIADSILCSRLDNGYLSAACQDTRDGITKYCVVTFPRTEGWL